MTCKNLQRITESIIQYMLLKKENPVIKCFEQFEVV